MPPRPASPQALPHPRAFTLVELLISTTLLALILVIISTLIANTTSAARRVDQLTAMDKMARGLFDSIASDLAATLPVETTTLALLASPDGGAQDALFLATTTRAFVGLPDWQDARLALVAYAPAPPSPTARRSLAPISWQESPFPSASGLFSNLATSLPQADATPTGLASDLATSVVRLAIMVHTADGRLLPLSHPELDAARHPDLPSLVLAQPSWHAITVAIALVPPGTLANFIEAGGDPASLAAALPHLAEGQLPRAAWDPSSAPAIAEDLAAVWPQAASTLQVFQRTFPLHR
jgi:prepilin-type N-terminal cleavage/methylation domain-containing protein